MDLDRRGLPLMMSLPTNGCARGYRKPESKSPPAGSSRGSAILTLVAAPEPEISRAVKAQPCPTWSSTWSVPLCSCARRHSGGTAISPPSRARSLPRPATPGARWGRTHRTPAGRREGTSRWRARASRRKSRREPARWATARTGSSSPRHGLARVPARRSSLSDPVPERAGGHAVLRSGHQQAKHLHVGSRSIALLSGVLLVRPALPAGTPPLPLPASHR